MHETKYRQLKFLGEWRKPAEGVKLSGAGGPAGTRNGCDSGEARNRVPKGQGGKLLNLSGKRTEGRYDLFARIRCVYLRICLFSRTTEFQSFFIF